MERDSDGSLRIDGMPASDVLPVAAAGPAVVAGRRDLPEAVR